MWGSRIRLMAVCIIAGWASAGFGQAVTMQSRLIFATNQPQALDTRLDDIEYRLRRIFQFEHYGFLGQSSTIIHLPSQSRVDLGHGYHLEVDARSRDGRVAADIQWFRGRDRLISTSVRQRRGVPAVLGGPPHNGGTLILVLEFQ